MAKLLLILHVLHAAKANKERREFLNISDPSRNLTSKPEMKIILMKGIFKGFSETRLIFSNNKNATFSTSKKKRIIK
jgi:hypothetical protein